MWEKGKYELDKYHTYKKYVNNIDYNIYEEYQKQIEFFLNCYEENEEKTARIKAEERDKKINIILGK